MFLSPLDVYNRFRNLGKPPADHNREFEVSDIQKPNSDITTDISVNVSSGTTANHPTILKIIFSNIDDVEHTFETGFPAPIRPQIAVSDDDSILILVSKNETDVTDIIPQSPIDGCWEAKRSDFEVWDKRGGTRLPPGENIEREYVLLADPESESCFSPANMNLVELTGLILPPMALKETGVLLSE